MLVFYQLWCFVIITKSSSIHCWEISSILGSYNSTHACLYYMCIKLKLLSLQDTSFEVLSFFNFSGIVILNVLMNIMTSNIFSRNKQ